MKLSIVVPVYNAERYLPECIESVLNQTNDNWELILVDDGSTDNSGKICDSFANEYPDKIFAFHKENEGQFLTRQYGIKKCTGEYIGFLDADDILANDYAKDVLLCVEKANEIQVICFSYARFSDTYNKEYWLPIDEKIRFFNGLSQCSEVYEHIINGLLTGSMWSKIFKRECLLNIAIDSRAVSDKRFAEDAYHSFFVISVCTSICYLNKILYYYRENLSGASEKLHERDLAYFNDKYVFELLQSCLPKWGMDTQDCRMQLYARNFNETVYYMLKFYRGAACENRRRQIVEYDWSSYLLENTLNNIQGNEFVRKPYIEIWKAFERKSHIKIYLKEKFKKFIGW